MDTFVIIVGLLVAVGTPIGTYIGARHGHQAVRDAAATAARAATRASEVSASTARQVAELNTETARHVAALTARTAEATNQTAQEEQRRIQFRWACESFWSDHDRAREGGRAVLNAMVDNDQLTQDELAQVASVLAQTTDSAVSRVGDQPSEGVAGAATTEDIGGSESGEEEP